MKWSHGQMGALYGILYGDHRSRIQKFIGAVREFGEKIKQNRSNRAAAKRPDSSNKQSSVEVETESV